MCLPWNHKWKTVDSEKFEVISNITNYRIGTEHIITQRCTHCGKEIVRKYRV